MSDRDSSEGQSDSAEVGAVVIGAGVIGCAVAEELVHRGIIPWILEAGPRIAEGVTSRNSGVIHAGLYYPPGSLKAQCCIEGKNLLYEWCEKRRVPHRRVGKWIVGDSTDREDLEALFANATACGATGLRWATPQELASALPQVRADLALYSADTGIVDPYLLSCSLIESAQAQGAELLTLTSVQGITQVAPQRFTIATSRGGITTSMIFNCGGLDSDEIANWLGTEKIRIYPWRGDYFRLSSRYRLNSLVYPSKKKGAPGLGIHLTVGLDGVCRLGPDVEAVESKTDVQPREDKLEAFFAAGSRYLKGLTREDLFYDSCGIRPKLRTPQHKSDPDFLVDAPLPGIVNLVGIESPGLTSCLSLARLAIKKALGN